MPHAQPDREFVLGSLQGGMWETLSAARPIKWCFPGISSHFPKAQHFWGLPWVPSRPSVLRCKFGKPTPEAGEQWESLWATSFLMENRLKDFVSCSGGIKWIFEAVLALGLTFQQSNYYHPPFQMYPWRRASTVLSCGFRDDGSSRPWWFGLMHLAILPLLVRAEAGWGWDWSHKIMSTEFCIVKPSRSCELVNARLLSAQSQNCGPNCEPWGSNPDLKSCPGLLLPWLDA